MHGAGRPASPGALGWPIPGVARTIVSPIPTAQVGAGQDVGAHVLGVPLGVVGADPDERLVPAHHLHDGAGLRPQDRHHPFGRGVTPGIMAEVVVPATPVLRSRIRGRRTGVVVAARAS